MVSALAIVDVDIRAGQDEQTRESLLGSLARYKGAAVSPLWINLLRERADLRTVCLVRDLAEFDDFLIDVVRSVPGVRGTTARLAFDGVVHSDVVTEMPLQDSALNRRAAATVLIKSAPGKDRRVYDALLALPAHPHVQVAWVLKLFHSSPGDLKLLLLGESSSALTGFVMSWVRTVHGVLDTELLTVLDWRILGTMADFVALIERFPEARPAG